MLARHSLVPIYRVGEATAIGGQVKKHSGAGGKYKALALNAEEKGGKMARAFRGLYIIMAVLAVVSRENYQFLAAGRVKKRK